MFFLKLFAWLKAYWYVPVAIVLAVLLFIFFKKEDNYGFKLLEIARNSFNRQMDVINDSEEKRKRAEEEITKKYEEEIKKLEELHAVSMLEIDKKTDKLAKDLVREYKDKPEELTKKMSELFGLEVF